MVIKQSLWSLQVGGDLLLSGRRSRLGRIPAKCILQRSNLTLKADQSDGHGFQFPQRGGLLNRTRERHQLLGVETRHQTPQTMRAR